MAGLLARYTHWLHTRWPAGEVEKLPVVRENGLTSIPGMRIVGDLTGIPLLKFSSKSAADAVRAIAAELQSARRADDSHDLIIIGGGVAGISAAIEAKRAGLRFLVLEAAEPFSTVANFPKAKPIYTYPREMQLQGGLQFTATRKEELLHELQQQQRAAGIEVTPARAERIERRGDLLLVHLENGDPLPAQRVIVAIGRSGSYRKLGVPGEELDKVYNRLFDPADFAGRNVLVVGGGDTALETAIALTESGANVTLSYRGREFTRPKPENIAKLEALLSGGNPQVEQPTQQKITPAITADLRQGQTRGTLQLALSSTIVRIEQEQVWLQNGTERAIPNDVVFTMLGRDVPLEFFRRSGIAIRGEETATGWIALGLFLAFCVFLFFWKTSEGFAQPAFDPWPGNMPLLLQSLGDWWQVQVADRSTFLGTLAVSLTSRSFYYTLLYSLAVVGFGIARIRRRRVPYVTWQTNVLIAIQVLPLFVLPEMLLPWMGYNGWFDAGAGRLVADNLFESYIPEAEYLARQWPEWGHPRAYWRAYGLILAWPLMVYNVFTDAPILWWLVISFVQTFVIIPLLIWRWGKGAYCSWICSCGALAETMGDQHRHKMPHGAFWNRFNMAGQVILAIAFALLFIRIGGWLWPGSPFAAVFHFLMDGRGAAGRVVNWASYKWTIDIVLGGVLGVGLYFKYSGRVWCRFFCPLAALMNVYTRFCRYRIFPEKEKCISCNVCTSVCHQGVDVMNFANKGIPVEDPQCVRCSACVQECPTGVLAFGRYDGAGGVVLDNIPASPVRMREEGSPQKTQRSQS
jgi:NosR/NirI family transcriptional regulator, nitrous oxide reductase regulator